MRRATAWFLLVAVGLAPRGAAGQELTGFERQRGLNMLSMVRDDIAKHYYDTLYAGVDLAAVFDAAEAQIRKAGALEQVLAAIAQATTALNDSHTIFIPPGLVYKADYGWEVRFVGDTCRVREVVPGSDADAKGLHVGDAVLTVQGIPLRRANLWQLRYLLHALRPLAATRLLVQSPGGETRQLDLASRVVERRSIVDPRSSVDVWDLIRDADRGREEAAVRWLDLGGRVLVFRLPRFYADDDWVDRFAKETKGHEAAIIDLRGNGGGAVDALARFLGVFFESDLAVARVVERRKQEDLRVKGRGAGRFAGKILVLVDAESASASELFARTMQLTGRGTVLGDRTAGAVRVSRLYSHLSGTQTGAFYGASVTVGDVIMPDGGVLEGVGVAPDELILPTGGQLAQRADPVMARALDLAGVPRTAEQAGRLPWVP